AAFWAIVFSHRELRDLDTSHHTGDGPQVVSHCGCRVFRHSAPWLLFRSPRLSAGQVIAHRVLACQRSPPRFNGADIFVERRCDVSAPWMSYKAVWSRPQFFLPVCST